MCNIYTHASIYIYIYMCANTYMCACLFIGTCGSLTPRAHTDTPSPPESRIPNQTTSNRHLTTSAGHALHRKWPNIHTCGWLTINAHFSPTHTVQPSHPSTYCLPLTSSPYSPLHIHCTHSPTHPIHP